GGRGGGRAKGGGGGPEGKAVEPGFLPCRSLGPPAPARSGRRRGQRDLTPRLTKADVAPMDSTPRTAARRPVGPPRTARAAAMASQSLDLSAARDRCRNATSSAGVGTVA